MYTMATRKRQLGILRTDRTTVGTIIEIQFSSTTVTFKHITKSKNRTISATCADLIFKERRTILLQPVPDINEGGG